MPLWDFLFDLGAEIRARVAGAGTVAVTGEELTATVTVTPTEAGPCPFSVFLQDEDEITIEFGEMSIIDFHGDTAEELQEACRDVVAALLGGKVSESVFIRSGKPARAVAHVRVPNRTITIRTSRGLSLFARKAFDKRYAPYAGSMSTGVV